LTILTLSSFLPRSFDVSKICFCPRTSPRLPSRSSFLLSWAEPSRTCSVFFPSLYVGDPCALIPTQSPHLSPPPPPSQSSPLSYLPPLPPPPFLLSLSPLLLPPRWVCFFFFFVGFLVALPEHGITLFPLSHLTDPLF